MYAHTDTNNYEILKYSHIIDIVITFTLYNVDYVYCRSVIK